MSFFEQIQLFVNGFLGAAIHAGSSAISQASSALNFF